MCPSLAPSLWLPRSDSSPGSAYQLLWLAYGCRWVVNAVGVGAVGAVVDVSDGAVDDVSAVVVGAASGGTVVAVGGSLLWLCRSGLFLGFAYRLQSLFCGCGWGCGCRGGCWCWSSMHGRC